MAEPLAKPFFSLLNILFVVVAHTPQALLTISSKRPRISPTASCPSSGRSETEIFNDQDPRCARTSYQSRSNSPVPCSASRELQLLEANLAEELESLPRMSQSTASHSGRAGLPNSLVKGSIDFPILMIAWCSSKANLTWPHWVIMAQVPCYKSRRPST